MKIHLECIPCNLRQILEASALAGADASTQEDIFVEALQIVQNYRSYATSPELGRALHGVVKKRTGNADPYNRIKAEAIAIANRLYPALHHRSETEGDRLRAALELSAAGNLIDAAVYGALSAKDWERMLLQELRRGLRLDDLEHLRAELERASTVLVVGDNAGETVFDRFLLTEINNLNPAVKQLFYGVRSAPIINDATADDAAASGIGEVAAIVDTGSTAPGLLLAEMTPEFEHLFYSADVVICKGQGNYETLSCSTKRPVYFLLKAKCGVIADDLGVEAGQYVLRRSRANPGRL